MKTDRGYAGGRASCTFYRQAGAQFSVRFRRADKEVRSVRAEKEASAGRCRAFFR